MNPLLPLKYRDEDNGRQTEKARSYKEPVLGATFQVTPSRPTH